MVKILIIEDELELLNNLGDYLSSFEKDFEVLTAQSGEGGLEVLENNPGVDLLLTDVRLPGIDGIEVVRRTVERWPDVRIAVMTAFGSAEIRSTVENEGALKFIEKPVDLDSLPDILRAVHQSRQRRSRAVGGLDILDVAQFVAMARETKVIRFQNERGQGTVVFDNGVIVHCSAGKFEGTEAFFDMALWGEGSFCELFDVETRRYRKNVDISTENLLDQATRLSEVIEGDPVDAGSSPPSEQPETEDTVLSKSRMPSDADAVPAPEAIPKPAPTGATRIEKGKESGNMNEDKKGKGQILTEHLEALLATSGDINGAVVIGHDGLVLASSLPMGGHDATRVGAEAAALLGLSKKTLATLKCGDFQGAILEGKNGWLINVAGGAKTVILGLTKADVNLGMAMMEMRDIAEDIAGVMG